ncbi:hypothetical protein D3C87_1518870 [compost metagenome]
MLEFVETHVDGRRAARIVFDDALRQHRLIDDKLADEVDQAVNTVEIDTDGLAGACIGRGIGIRLRCGRRCRSLTLFDGGVDALGDLRRCDGSLDDCGDVGLFRPGGHNGRFPFRITVESRQVERNRDHRQLFRIRSGFRKNRGDFEIAIPFGEFEDAADSLFTLVGRDRNRPGEIGRFWIELVERG